jgi:hypothetical protein
MTPAEARDQLAQMLADYGEDVQIKRQAVTVTVRAKELAYRPEDYVGDLQQSIRRIVVQAQDLDNSGLLPLVAGKDHLVMSGRTMVITAIDDTTRRIQGIVIGYELQVAGR